MRIVCKGAFTHAIANDPGCMNPSDFRRSKTTPGTDQVDPECGSNSRHCFDFQSPNYSTPGHHTLSPFHADPVVSLDARCLRDAYVRGIKRRSNHQGIGGIETNRLEARVRVLRPRRIVRQGCRVCGPYTLFPNSEQKTMSTLPVRDTKNLLQPCVAGGSTAAVSLRTDSMSARRSYPQWDGEQRESRSGISFCRSPYCWRDNAPQVSHRSGQNPTPTPLETRFTGSGYVGRIGNRLLNAEPGMATPGCAKLLPENS
jgi:hypothetical protein